MTFLRIDRFDNRPNGEITGCVQVETIEELMQHDKPKINDMALYRLVTNNAAQIGRTAEINCDDYLYDDGINQWVRVDNPKPSPLTEQVGGSHYKNLAIQPVEFIHKNGLNFIEGAVVKYICRWRNKNGVEDLKKARHYLDMLIEMEEKKC